MKGSLALRLLIALAAVLPLRAHAQSDDSAQPTTPTPGAAAGTPEQPPALPAVAPPIAEPSTGGTAPARRGGAVSIAPEEDEEPAPPPSSEPPAPTAEAAAPPTAEPESAAAATASASPPAEIEEEPETPVPFIAGLSWGHAYNTAGLSRSAYQTFNPQYAWTFNAVLGYRFDDRTSLALSQALAIELTDSDTTNTRQEPWLLDTAIDAERELIEYELDDDHTLGAIGALGVLLPTSKPSRAATMLFAGRVKLGGQYVADDVLRGLGTGVSLSYAHRFLRSNVLEAEQAFPCAEADLLDASRNCTHLGSSTNTRDLFVLGFEAGLGLTHELTLGANVSFGWNRAASLGEEQVTLETGSVVTLGDDSLTHWRNSRVIGVSLEYAFTDWFSGTTLVTNSFAERSAADGQYRAPFNGQDMVLGLELSVSFDALYGSTHGHAGDR